MVFSNFAALNFLALSGMGRSRLTVQLAHSAFVQQWDVLRLGLLSAVFGHAVSYGAGQKERWCAKSKEVFSIDGSVWVSLRK